MTIKEEMQADHDEIVADGGGAIRWNNRTYPCAIAAVSQELGIEMGGNEHRFEYQASVRIDHFASVNETPKVGDQVKLIDPQFEAEEKLGRVVARSRDSLGAVMVFVIETREM